LVPSAGAIASSSKRSGQAAEQFQIPRTAAGGKAKSVEALAEMTLRNESAAEGGQSSTAGILGAAPVLGFGLLESARTDQNFWRPGQ